MKSNNYVIADAVRIESVGTVAPPPVVPPVAPTIPPPVTTPVVRILDNGETGHSTTGFANFGAGYKTDLGYVAAGNGSATSTWTFTVTPGRYKVSTTWVTYVNRATDAPYTIYDGNTVVGQQDINQKVAPNDFTEAGLAWENIDTVDISSTTLKVRLTNQANNFVIADAIRIESIPTTLLANTETNPQHTTATTIDEHDAQAAVEFAVDYWAARGTNKSTLDTIRNIDIFITDLPGKVLGYAGNNSIYLDRNAAGFGWTTNDEEAGRISLNETVAHELGHLLGHNHDSEFRIMAPTIDPIEEHTDHDDHDHATDLSLEVLFSEFNLLGELLND